MSQFCDLDAHACLSRSFLYLPCSLSLSMCLQVITTLAGNLLAIKSRVGTTEGMLPVAEMALPLFLRCPGLLRCDLLHHGMNHGVGRWFSPMYAGQAPHR